MHSQCTQPRESGILTCTSDHLLEDYQWLLDQLAITDTQFDVNSRLQLFDDSGSEQGQVGRDVVSNDLMRNTSIRMPVALDHAHGEGSDTSHIINGIPEAEVFCHEDLTDHGTRDSGQLLVHDVHVEHWTIFRYSLLEEQVWIAKVFSIMGCVTLSDGDRWDGLIEGHGHK